MRKSLAAESGEGTLSEGASEDLVKTGSADAQASLRLGSALMIY